MACRLIVLPADLAPAPLTDAETEQAARERPATRAIVRELMAQARRETDPRRAAELRTTARQWAEMLEE